MIIVAGALYVDVEARNNYLAGCLPVVQQARRAKGCLDFAVTADLADESRINVYERWESDEDVAAFRGSGPSAGQLAAIRSAAVQRYRISSVEDA